MIKITDIDDRQISYFKNLRYTPLSHSKEKLFMTEGEKITIKLLESGFIVNSIFAVEEFYQNNETLISNKKIPCDKLYYADKSVMNQIVGFKLHSGVMALANQPESPVLSKLESPIVALNGIINSENVGSIIRNCAAFGVNSVIVDKKSGSPYLRRAVRVSMGAVMDMKIFFSDNLLEDLLRLKNASYKIISSEITENSTPINEVKFPEKIAIIFGNEAQGVDDEIQKFSDLIVNIPTTDSVNSINVASSSAVFLSKIFEQKRQGIMI